MKAIISMKSCFSCRNHNICKHRSRIFDNFELASFIMEDISGLINLISMGIACRCKYYEPHVEGK
jgi:hypothetical protein